MRCAGWSECGGSVRSGSTRFGSVLVARCGVLDSLFSVRDARCAVTDTSCPLDLSLFDCRILSQPVVPIVFGYGLLSPAIIFPRHHFCSLPSSSAPNLLSPLFLSATSPVRSGQDGGATLSSRLGLPKTASSSGGGPIPLTRRLSFFVPSVSVQSHSPRDYFPSPR